MGFLGCTGENGELYLFSVKKRKVDRQGAMVPCSLIRGGAGRDTLNSPNRGCLK